MLLLCAFAVALKAQPDDPKELLERVRDKLKETIAGLPKYMCTLTVDRVQDDTGCRIGHPPAAIWWLAEIRRACT